MVTDLGRLGGKLRYTELVSRLRQLRHKALEDPLSWASSLDPTGVQSHKGASIISLLCLLRLCTPLVLAFASPPVKPFNSRISS
jgi:hypothetical protein